MWRQFPQFREYYSSVKVQEGTTTKRNKKPGIVSSFILQPSGTADSPDYPERLSLPRVVGRDRAAIKAQIAPPSSFMATAQGGARFLPLKPWYPALAHNYTKQSIQEPPPGLKWRQQRGKRGVELKKGANGELTCPRIQPQEH